MAEMRRVAMVLTLAAVVHAGAALPSWAQEPEGRDRVRLGISLGGTHRIGVSVEYLRSENSAELAVGTFRWEIVSVSVTGRRYVGEGRTRPYAGVGLWSMFAAPGDDFGSLTFLRIPLGMDWQVAGNHYAGLEASLSYAIAVSRPDPRDRSPLRRHFLPLPALYYKFQHDVEPSAQPLGGGP